MGHRGSEPTNLINLRSGSRINMVHVEGMGLLHEGFHSALHFKDPEQGSLADQLIQQLDGLSSRPHKSIHLTGAAPLPHYRLFPHLFVHRACIPRETFTVPGLWGVSERCLPEGSMLHLRPQRQWALEQSPMVMHICVEWILLRPRGIDSFSGK